MDATAERVSVMVPMQVLTDIDNGRNPVLLTRERLERAATENQFMNGKIAAIEVRRTVQDDVALIIIRKVIPVLLE